MGNPFTLTFGKKPTEYIQRHENSNEIISAFTNEPARCQSYLIQGIRGSGKTVLMTAVSKEICKDEDWICVDLNSSLNLIDDFAYRLSDACRNMSNIFERGFDISIAGFGIGIGEKEYKDSISICETIIETLAKKGKKIIITIDEVNNDKSMKFFASQFQIWVRKDYPIYLIMTGLYENINAIQNNPQLTFLLRTPKITLEALGISQITRQYENIFNISTEKALEFGKMTKGYAFAFQALGMLLWDNDCKNIDEVLNKLDDLLDEYVYRKIWQDISDIDKSILINIPDDASIKTSNLCEKAGITLQVFSKYRDRLINRGLIRPAGHGYVELSLPRFSKVCKYY